MDNGSKPNNRPAQPVKSYKAQSSVLEKHCTFVAMCIFVTEIIIWHFCSEYCKWLSPLKSCMKEIKQNLILHSQFLELILFQTKYYLLCSFTFLYIFGYELNTVNCILRICHIISCNSSIRLQECE